MSERVVRTAQRGRAIKLLAVPDFDEATTPQPRHEFAFPICNGYRCYRAAALENGFDGVNLEVVETLSHGRKNGFDK